MTTQELAEGLMELFRKINAEPTHTLDMQMMNNWLLDKLNPAERDLLTPAIEYLVARDLVERGERMELTSLTLTQAGYYYLYPLNEEVTITRIGKGILHQFEKIQAQTGHGLPRTMLNNNLFEKLNPRERSLAPAAIQRLVEEGLVKEVEASVPVLLLTEAGYGKLS